MNDIQKEYEVTNSIHDMLNSFKANPMREAQKHKAAMAEDKPSEPTGAGGRDPDVWLPPAPVESRCVCACACVCVYVCVCACVLSPLGVSPSCVLSSQSSVSSKCTQASVQAACSEAAVQETFKPIFWRRCTGEGEGESDRQPEAIWRRRGWGSKEEFKQQQREGWRCKRRQGQGACLETVSVVSRVATTGVGGECSILNGICSIHCSLGLVV